MLYGRQDIALRDHRERDDNADDCNKGNFIEILNVMKKESSEERQCMKRLPLNATYCSKSSQNDMLESCASVIKNKILDDIKQSGMYAIIVDEARNFSRTEQMCLYSLY